MDFITSTIIGLAYFLLFPGVVFGILVGWLDSWIFRKLKARLQSRRGPPWYQPIADLIKLYTKQVIIPSSSQKMYFMAAPLLAVAVMLSIPMLMPIGFTSAPIGFAGDIVVVLYLLVILGVVIALGGSSSGSPYGAIAASRELVLIIGYESAFITGVLIPVVEVKSLMFTNIMTYQLGGNWLLFRYPFAAAAVFLAMVAKLGIKPFDIPEAKQEIVSGPYTEYSGPLMGSWYLAKMLTWFILTFFFVDIFLGGGDGLPIPFNVVLSIVKALILVIVFTIFDVANARYRIDQAFNKYFGVVLLLALVDVVRLSLGLRWW